MKNGLVQIYTGDGKGKTTAATGLALRAKSAGLNVFFIYFNKRKQNKYGEDKLLEKTGIKTRFFASKHPAFVKGISKAEMHKETVRGLKFVNNLFKKENYDVIILDEILISIKDRFIKEDELIELIRLKPSTTELILTGRGLTKKISKYASLISNINLINHPYNNGFVFRQGIEL